MAARTLRTKPLGLFPDQPTPRLYDRIVEVLLLTRDEARHILGEMSGAPRLIVLLLYRSGLRLLEALRLRVKDLDFARHELTVREGKGDKDRRTMLPRAAEPALRQQIELSRRFHDEDLTRGFGSVELPHAFERKSPGAAFDFRWKYVFPAGGLSEHPRSGVRRRHPLHEPTVSKAISAAARRADITKRVTAQTVSALVCNALDRGGLRHPHGAGTAGPQRRSDHNDLHARPEPGGTRRPQPG